MSRNGVIALSYARSAGTGDQPVPGTVTSRRNSSRHERQAVKLKKQEEEEREKKQKLAQDEIAKILAFKWAEEDKKKGSKRRHKDERGRTRSSSSGEDAQPRRSSSSPSPRGVARDISDRSSRGGGSRGSRALPAAQDEDDAQDDGEIAPGHERGGGGWVSIDLGRAAREAEQLHRAAAVSSGGSSASGSQRRRFTDSGSSGAAASGGALQPAAAASGGASQAAVTDAAAASHRASPERGTTGNDHAGRSAGGRGDASTSIKMHSKKVANVFGFGLEDDEDDEGAKRQLELAARSKRSKLGMHAEVVGGKSGDKEGGGSLGAAASVAGNAAGKKQFDMCTHLMKMAEWKRSCGGKRLPMPKELEAEVAKAMMSLG